MNTPNLSPRLSKSKQWKLTITTHSNHCFFYYFDTKADADTASAMLFAHPCGNCEVTLTPIVSEDVLRGASAFSIPNDSLLM